VILHELVHAFEPRHVDLQATKGLFCEVFFAEAFPNIPPKIIFEQGEIFETMCFGGIAHRFNENEIRWCGDEDSSGSHFTIDDDHQYHRFFETFNLKIIRKILKRKKRPIIVRHFLESIRHRVVNLFAIFRQ
jgi:hypothetical protein